MIGFKIMHQVSESAVPILVPSPSNNSSVRVIPEEWKVPIKLADFESVVKARDIELEYRIVRVLTENERMVSRLYLDESTTGLNRYRDMVPFRENRVMLSNGTYINASYMPSADGKNPKEFIASQGPLPNTIGDQWDMIWGEGISGVLTIGSLREGSVEKIAQYWPESKNDSVEVQSQGTSKSFSLKCIGEEEPFAGLKKRNILVSHMGKERTVRHYHFTAWPDHGAVPPSVLLGLADVIKRERKSAESQAPVLVHCSAGVGRTGCVLTMSNCVEWIEQQFAANSGDLSKCHISVMQIVLALRECRVHIIERTWQYESIYSAIFELLKTLRRND